MNFKKKLENEAHWKHVFSSDNFEHRWVASASSPGCFPTSKSALQMVRPRSPLMRDLLIHLDTDPDVVAIAAYPEETEYWTIATNGEPTIRTHIPDVATLRRGGRVVVVDVVLSTDRKGGATIEQKATDLKAHYRGLGAEYYLLDEEAIRLQPLFDNRRDMWQHKAFHGQEPEIASIAAEILAQPLPLNIGQLAARLAPRRSAAEWNDEFGPLYTAIKQLVMSGRITVDLTRRFSRWTVLHLPSRTTGVRRPDTGRHRRPIPHAPHRPQTEALTPRAVQ
ncbi:hypothetical protein [Rhizobium leguminosarum]|uniref:hypothetical protein n=1 Tax=Rhizobium leguminosarum TaxID=384 RepID=UPI001C94EEB1|nr:hypothetical protein [Rhizobium leguminosarum]MBY5511866.1 hypothetical protein [Rhizobium leguminosarum]